VLGPTACGPHERRKALAILRAAKRLIIYRAWAGEQTNSPVHIPTREAPLVYIVLDEIDELFEPGDNMARATASLLKYVVSKGRSEGVGVILIGQRGTAAWLGGAAIRANVNTFVFTSVQRKSEMTMAAGEVGLTFPDMGDYGEGHEGVVLTYRKGQPWFAGRSFDLTDLDDLEKVVQGRYAPTFERAAVDYFNTQGSEFSKLLAGEFDSQALLVGAGAGAAGASGGPPPAPPSGGSATTPSGGSSGDDEDEEFGDLDAPSTTPVVGFDEGADDEEFEESDGWPATPDDEDLALLDQEAEEALPDELRNAMNTMEQIKQKTQDAAQRLNEKPNAAKDLTPEERRKVDAMIRAANEEAARTAKIPPDKMADIAPLLNRPEGASTRELMDALGVSRSAVGRYCAALKAQGLADVRPPHGPTARWYATPDGYGG
jgi:hypothetical protein